MDEGDFFVMLETQSGGITPMLDDEQELAIFHTEDEAVDGALGNTLGSTFGYEIFCRGEGCANG